MEEQTNKRPEPKPYSENNVKDKPISKIYANIDNDLARDNLENDMSEADKQNM